MHRVSRLLRSRVQTDSKCSRILHEFYSGSPKTWLSTLLPAAAISTLWRCSSHSPWKKRLRPHRTNFYLMGSADGRSTLASCGYKDLDRQRMIDHIATEIWI